MGHNKPHRLGTSLLSFLSIKQGTACTAGKTGLSHQDTLCCTDTLPVKPAADRENLLHSRQLGVQNSVLQKTVLFLPTAVPKIKTESKEVDPVEMSQLDEAAAMEVHQRESIWASRKLITFSISDPNCPSPMPKNRFNQHKTCCIKM